MNFLKFNRDTARRNRMLLSLNRSLRRNVIWLSGVLAIFISVVLVSSALAAPLGSPYNLGETLNPTCAPGDANCTVNAPFAGTAVNTGLAFFNTSSTATSTGNLTFATTTGLFTIIASSSFQTVSSTNLFTSGYLQIAGQSYLAGVS